jgi:AmmeMemoRadiSam system protein B
MDATYYKPKLRWPIDIQLQPGVNQNEQVLVVQCPLGVSPRPLVLIAGVAPVVSLFQGELSFEEILARCAPYGLQEQTLRELIRLFDEGLFLANARFFAAQREVKESFTSLTVRPPALAGLAYPESREQLSKFVSDMIVPIEMETQRPELRCLVAPHIDYRRGGRCYGQIYPHLASSTADLYLLMGTSHQYSERMFHLSAKDFSSPLGILPCDSGFVTKLANRFGISRAFADEYLHRKEHSLELQLPFISTVRPGVAIVPILVGSFHKAVASGRSPREFEEYETFVEALVESIREVEREGRRVCFIAGVDMAHVGAVFGDEWQLSPEKMVEISERDARYLDAIAAHSSDALFAHVAEDGDARRLCGFPTMHTILDVLTRLSHAGAGYARVYEQAVDYESSCAVTFAGLALG